jgi:hypothetical protein
MFANATVHANALCGTHPLIEGRLIERMQKPIPPGDRSTGEYFRLMRS